MGDPNSSSSPSNIPNSGIQHAGNYFSDNDSGWEVVLQTVGIYLGNKTLFLPELDETRKFYSDMEFLFKDIEINSLVDLSIKQKPGSSILSIEKSKNQDWVTAFGDLPKPSENL